MEDFADMFTFEISNEVANKVGGIYTVLRSKAENSVDEMGDNYCMVGLCNERFVATEVEKMEPKNHHLKCAVDAMRKRDVGLVTGRWLIEGCPTVVLFDINSLWGYYSEWAQELYDSAGVGVPNHDSEAKQAILFGFVVTWFLGEFRAQIDRATPGGKGSVIIGHFHEWLAGIGLLMCRLRRIDVSTIFTTHATLLGRYICASNIDFYNNLSKFDCDTEAGNRQIYHRYCIERAAVQSAHVFTTVSDITGLEATHLLKREPDLILPNGLKLDTTHGLHEFQNLHAIAKEKIHSFVRGHFNGNYDFDLDNTMYMFIAGRYEYSNKGADMFIECMARLNQRLKHIRSDVTVVAFLIFPGQTNNFNVESLKGQATVKKLKENVDIIKEELGDRLFDCLLRGNMPGYEDLLSPSDIMKLKRCLYVNQSASYSLPPIVTHNMLDDNNDPILKECRRKRLLNKREDRVKVIFHPEFLSSTSPLLSMDYDEFVRGCHLGIFPSYYEPWGYTPAECTVRGIPSVTSNLSGFGCYMQKHVDDPEAYGIYIVDRRFRSPEESCNQLTDYLFNFCKMSRRERIIQRNRTERLSDVLSWERLSGYYRNARRLAVERTHPEFLENLTASPAASVHLPRPMSAPNSPFGSRVASPFPSDDEDERRPFRITDDDGDSGLFLRTTDTTSVSSVGTTSSQKSKSAGNSDDVISDDMNPEEKSLLSKYGIKKIQQQQDDVNNNLPKPDLDLSTDLLRKAAITSK